MYKSIANPFDLSMISQTANSSLRKPKIPTIEETCSICCEVKIIQLTQLQQKLRAFRLPEICYQCWFNHIKNYVMRISYRAGDDVISPFNQGPNIDIIRCINSLNQADAKQIQQYVFKKYCSFTRDVQKCPSETCDYVYIGQKCKWGSNQNIYNCPKCQMPLSTQNPYSFKSLMASFYLLMANKCPKCDIPIQKISGCPHMTCPCGHHFCWYCYKDHPSGSLKKVYQTHTIPQCAFIFISKIVIVIICILSLLITFSGTWMLKQIYGIMSAIFKVLIRAALLDVFIFGNILLHMMQRRRKNPFRSNYNLKKYILTTIGLLLGFIFTLYWFDELTYFGWILLAQLVLASLLYGIGQGIIYSIQTWFQFIA